MSRVPTTESTAHITKLVFNEDSVGSAAARQLEPWQPWTEALIGFLSIFVVLLLTLEITQTKRKYVYPNTVQLFFFFLFLQFSKSSLCTHGTNRSKNSKRQLGCGRWCLLVCGEYCFCIYLTINLMQKWSLFPSNCSIMVWAPPGGKRKNWIKPKWEWDVHLFVPSFCITGGLRAVMISQLCGVADKLSRLCYIN